jgi:type II secretory pathway pseudopilin PulG
MFWVIAVILVGILTSANQRAKRADAMQQQQVALQYQQALSQRQHDFIQLARLYGATDPQILEAMAVNPNNPGQVLDSIMDRDEYTSY